jgi:iron complex transport system ATP-binding protein
VAVDAQARRDGLVMLAARSASLGYGGRIVLHGASLAVAPGEVLAVVGPNGAGKSTLLRLLSGECEPAAGTVALDDVPLHRWNARALARRRAVLPQDSRLIFPVAVPDVVMLGRAPRAGRRSWAQDTAVVAAALAEAGAAHLAGRIYTMLSGGERQRVQLARVLAQVWPDDGDPAPKYLLLDEPIANLDPAQQHATMRIVRRFAARGGGVLAIVHDLNMAAMYADRVCVIEAGRVVSLDTPERVFTPKLVRRVFDLDVSVLPHPSRDCVQMLPA